MLTISIVSHNQLHIMGSLLKNIINETDFNIILTINTDENEDIIETYPRNRISIIKNDKPLGFTQNHNNAFRKCTTDYFLILNPDVVIENNLIKNVLSEMIENNIKIFSPVAVSKSGKFLDNARRFPNLLTPLFRLISKKNKIDYNLKENDLYKVDWISGMFIMITSDVFSSLEGFDQQFFLYYDDVDLCRRAKEKGYTIYLTTTYKVVHEGNRLSRKSIKYFLIHLHSLFKYHFKHGI